MARRASGLRRRLFHSWRRFRRRQFYAIARRYRDFTMIAPHTYVRNLLIAQRHAGVPGAVVECGVWRGGMSAGLAELLGRERDYVLFDSFEGLPPAQAVDGASAQAWQADTDAPGYFDNCTAAEADARRAMGLAGVAEPTILKGWFQDTLPDFDSSTPIAILRLDGDWYDSTMVCLEHLYPAVVPGGVVIIDDYHAWDGCTRAVHEYLARERLADRISQFENDVCFITKRGASSARQTGDS